MPASARPSPSAPGAPTRLDPGVTRVGLPGWTVLPAGIAVAFLGLPLVAMLTRVPWAELPALVTSESSRAALALSLRTSLAATILCLLLGVPLALVLARARFPGPARAGGERISPRRLFDGRRS